MPESTILFRWFRANRGGSSLLGRLSERFGGVHDADGVSFAIGSEPFEARVELTHGSTRISIRSPRTLRNPRILGAHELTRGPLAVRKLAADLPRHRWPRWVRLAREVALEFPGTFESADIPLVESALRALCEELNQSGPRPIMK